MAGSTNVPGNQSKDLGRNNRKNQFDQLAKSLKDVLDSEKVKDKDTDGLFYGFVLYEHPLTLQDFKSRFNSNKKFYNSVLEENDQSPDAASNTAHVKEIYVNIPQITDFLPKPDLSVLMDLIKYKDQLDKKTVTSITSEAETDKTAPPRPKAAKTSLEKISSKFEETIDIISMYPRVYRYCTSNQSCGLGTACEVYIPSAEDKLLPTMSYGVYKKQIGGGTKISTESPIRSLMEKLVKAKNKGGGN